MIGHVGLHKLENHSRPFSRASERKSCRSISKEKKCPAFLVCHLLRVVGQANPKAFGNILRRFLEASGRGQRDADAETSDQLRSWYEDLDAELEGA